jgi:hypothetical protein
MKYFDVNDHFFEQIDSEEKAYFLGFLYSDGGISDNCATLKLHQQDISILEKLKNLISPSTPIKITQGRYCYFRINRAAICQQLIKLGCTPNKSLTLIFPSLNQVSEQLIPHFIRGYSDGDGSISFTITKTNRKDFSWAIVSTKNFCQQLSQILKDKLNINCYIKTTDRSRRNDITQTLSVGGSLQLKKLLDWLYCDASIYMERKYNKYLEFQNQISNNSLQSKFSSRSSFKLDENLAISLYINGNSKRKVAQLMNCNARSVYSILKKKKVETIKNNSYTREKAVSSKAKEIVLLYNNGTTIKEIAAKFNCSPSNITVILNKNGVKVDKSFAARILRENL